MRIIRRMIAVVALGVGVAAAWSVPTGGSWIRMSAHAQPPSQPRQQEEFVPIDELPPEEQVPAAPMVVAAYSFVWVAFLAYVISLVKRIRRVEADLVALERERR